MFRVPRLECEPAPLLFARLLRCPTDRATGADEAENAENGENADETLFGDDVGVELRDVGESDARWRMDEVREPTVRVEERPRTAFASEMKALLLGTLDADRGVLAGLPAIEGTSVRPQERICALSANAVAGKAWWWLWWLRRTPFSRRDSYSGRADEITYRVGGDATQSFDWFPSGKTYGTAPGQLTAYLNFGLAVHVRELPPAPREPEYAAQVQHAAVPLYMQLDAATHGLSPAVFAAFVVGDDLKSPNSPSPEKMGRRRLPATAPTAGLDAPDGESTQSTESRPRRVAAVVAVCQVHTFRLSDMLGAYAGMGHEEDRRGALEVVSRALVEISDKLEALAALRILKLSMTADSVVFCPELRASDDAADEADEADENEAAWEVHGHAFRTHGFDTVAGRPFFVDFDHRVSKRLQHGQGGHDTKSMYLMMMVVLLAAIRAQFGSVYAEVLEIVSQVDAFKDAMECAGEKLDAFRATFLATFQHARVERHPLPKTLFANTIDDFAALVLTGAAGATGATADGLATMRSATGDRAAFADLLEWLLASSAYVRPGQADHKDANVGAAGAAGDAEGANVASAWAAHRKAMERVRVVVDARRQRREERFRTARMAEHAT